MLKQRMLNHVDCCSYSECQYIEEEFNKFAYICYKEELLFEFESVICRTNCFIGSELNEVMKKVEKYFKKGGNLITVGVMEE